MKEQGMTTKEEEGRVTGAHLSLFVCLSSARLVYHHCSTHDKDGEWIVRMK